MDFVAHILIQLCFPPFTSQLPFSCLSSSGAKTGNGVLEEKTCYLVYYLFMSLSFLVRAESELTQTTLGLKNAEDEPFISLYHKDPSYFAQLIIAASVHYPLLKLYSKRKLLFLLKYLLCSPRATFPVHFVLVILEIGSHELFAWADLKP
jgi:hypothetical protein